MTLNYWKRVHKEFFGEELKANNIEFSEETDPFIFTIMGLADFYIIAKSGLSLANILYIVIYMFIVAFVEEVLYRGIILNNLKQKSVNFAIVGSSVLATYGSSYS